jgi:hypothetical protein
MSEIDRTADAIRRRDWTKMRAFWIDRLALAEGFASDSSLGIGELAAMESIGERLLRQRRTADDAYRAAMHSYDSEQLSKPKKGINEEQARAERKRFENNADRARFQKCPAIEEAIDELIPTLFGEGIRLLNKSVHVLGCAEKEAHQGMQTWSLCSAYQASLFAGKALLALCGVGIAEFQSRTVLCDVFPEPVARGDRYINSRFHLIGRRLDHRDIWIIVQRVLRVTFCELWPAEIVDTLKSIDEKQFAKQRNDIQYKNRHWPLPDLYEFVADTSFGKVNSWENPQELNFERADCSLVGGFYFVRLAASLAADVAALSNKLKSDIGQLRRCLTAERHPLYFDTLLPNDAAAALEDTAASST